MRRNWQIIETHYASDRDVLLYDVICDGETVLSSLNHEDAQHLVANRGRPNWDTVEEVYRGGNRAAWQKETWLECLASSEAERALLR